jgi:hypothetical protein
MSTTLIAIPHLFRGPKRRRVFSLMKLAREIAIEKFYSQNGSFVFSCDPLRRSFQKILQKTDRGAKLAAQRRGTGCPETAQRSY